MFIQFLEAIDGEEYFDDVWEYIENVLSKEVMKYQVPSDDLNSRKEFEELLCQLVAVADKTTVCMCTLGVIHMHELAYLIQC